MRQPADDAGGGRADVQVVQKMKSAGLKTVVVLVAGRPMILDPILPIADAIVVAWLPGTEGAGVTDVLFGDVHPTGKLPAPGRAAWLRSPSTSATPTTIRSIPYAYGLTY